MEFRNKRIKNSNDGDVPVPKVPLCWTFPSLADGCMSRPQPTHTMAAFVSMVMVPTTPTRSMEDDDDDGSMISSVGSLSQSVRNSDLVNGTPNGMISMRASSKTWVVVVVMVGLLAEMSIL